MQYKLMIPSRLLCAVITGTLIFGITGLALSDRQSATKKFTVYHKDLRSAFTPVRVKHVFDDKFVLGLLPYKILIFHNGKLLSTVTSIDYDQSTRRLTGEEIDHTRGNKKIVYVWDSRWESPVEARTKDSKGINWVLEFSHNRHETETSISAFRDSKPVSFSQAIKQFKPIHEMFGPGLQKSF